MTDRRYYLTDFFDEIMPCDCTLAAWAEWLSKPDPEWQRDEAAQPGDRFKASVMRFDEDITATFTEDGWTFDRDPSAADFLAVRFGPGLGWSADDIVWGEDMKAALVEFLDDEAQGKHSIGDTAAIAVGFDEPDVILIYRSATEISAEAVQ